MVICGIQKLSMVDFPGKLAATVFTGGCNLRCPFCHNALLVTRLSETPRLPQEEILNFLKGRKGLLEGVVLSGGEPLMQKGASDFLEEVKQMGFAVKLDTNGCYPEALEKILLRGAVDYVAMDIKNCPERYGETVGLSGFDLGPVEESIRLIRESGIDYEFRTTCVKNFHGAQEIAAIGSWLQGSRRYFLQNFVDSGNLIGSGITGLSEEEMRHFAEIAKPFFGSVNVRGI